MAATKKPSSKRSTGPLLPGSRLQTPSKGVPNLLAKPTADKRYTVKAGDSLSTIAKKNDTTLAKILALNPRLRTDPKYAGGNRIFRGTKVRLK